MKADETSKLKIDTRADLKAEMLKIHKLDIKDYASGGFGAR
jgi:hypothetical protein